MSISEIEAPESNHEIKMSTGRKARATPRKGGGADNPNLVVEMVGRIENLNAELAKEKSDFMLRCKGFQEDIRAVLDEAQEKGLPKKPLKAIVKQRALEQKAKAVRDNLEDLDHLSAFDIMKSALGQLSGTPLGQAAMHSAH